MTAAQSALTNGEGEAPAQAPLWGAVCSMALCVFVLIASEFMPVSLLTPIASDLGMTEGHAGQAISVSGIFAVLTSLLTAPLISRLDRRVVLFTFTLLLSISGLTVSIAPNDGIFMIGRALLGVSIGGFWSMSTATVMRLVPAQSVPKALALINGGNALAATLAAPLGSFLGQYIGWRGSFFIVVPLAIAALMWQWLTMPRMRSAAQTRSANPFALLRRPVIVAGMAANILLYMGQFSLFTYLRPYLETVTQVDVTTLSLLLLLLGASGLIGTYAIGVLLRTGLFLYLISIPILLGNIAILLILMGHSLASVAILLFAWGFVATGAPVAWGTWLASTLPDDAEAGGGLLVATIQFAITIGAGLGGLLFDAFGWSSTFALSAILLFACGATAALTWRLTSPKPGEI